MEKISWSPDFSVGILEIDRQHKELINLINKSIESINSVRNVEIVAEILSEMVSYANYHFETEEQYMREHNYPDYLIQKEQHSQFVEKNIFLCKDLINDPLDVVSAEILSHLENWLENHILESDMKYKSFFNEKGLH